MLLCGLSVQLIHCKALTLTPDRVSDIQNHYRICSPGNDGKCEELQNQVDCASCTGVGACKCRFTCNVGGTSSAKEKHCCFNDIAVLSQCTSCWNTCIVHVITMHALYIL